MSLRNKGGGKILTWNLRDAFNFNLSHLLFAEASSEMVCMEVEERLNKNRTENP